ncbi:HGL204Cp [Eremothecium sinecaudum]|uniref:HGL204Cp n=1 Tax=Eremothecium sinecaudum TaxID=45286 RepID=A0A0X8HUS8_9SACH|nr:HGL204Cp [Eremothecium sinecaudum]AMD22136.1 HGL204Cp [Eremothecium sinecaudum]
MFRDRTNLFLSYHRTFPRQRSVYNSGQEASDPFLGSNESIQDLENHSASETYPMVDFSRKANTLPPAYFDLTHDLDTILAENADCIIQLTKLYRKNLLPGFEDKTQDEKQIEELSYQVISNYQKCYSIMKRLQNIKETQVYRGTQLRKGELVILDNCCKMYAVKIQNSSNKFRVMQNNYLKFLNNDDFKPLPSVKDDEENLALLEEEEGHANQLEVDSYSRETLMKQRQKHQNTRLLEQRDEEITKLAKGVLEVSTIFREMQALIIDQGTVIDRIDYNLENTNVQLRQAQGELTEATRYQKRSQKCRVIFLLSLLVLLLFVFVLLKPHRSERHSDNNDNNKDGKNTGNKPEDDVVPEIEVTPPEVS